MLSQRRRASKDYRSESIPSHFVTGSHVISVGTGGNRNSAVGPTLGCSHASGVPNVMV